MSVFVLSSGVDSVVVVFLISLSVCIVCVYFFLLMRVMWVLMLCLKVMSFLVFSWWMVLCIGMMFILSFFVIGLSIRW